MAARVATMLPKLFTLNMHICKDVHVYVCICIYIKMPVFIYMFKEHIYIYVNLTHEQ